MAIDKKRSPLWVRIVIWVLIVGLVAGVGILSIGSILSSWNQTTDLAQQENQEVSAEESQKRVAEIDARYQKEVDELQKTVDAKPKDKDALVKLAQAYTSWGTELSNIQESNAQATGFVRISQSREFWEKAYNLDKKDTEIGGEFATALYYSGDTTQAVTVAREVLKAKPDFGIMWYNLGQFLSASQPQQAIEAFQQAIKYDTEQKYSTQAQGFIDSLKAAK